jgi:NTE family protein
LRDGYYTSPLPVSEAVKHDMDVIIAVTFFDPIDMHADNYAACISNYYTIQGDATTRYQMALSIDMHTHEIIIIKVDFKVPSVYGMSNISLKSSKPAKSPSMRVKMISYPL